MSDGAMCAPEVTSMRTLIVGAGALGGVIATRLAAAGASVCVATRTAEAAAQLASSGLTVTGVGGAARVRAQEVAPLRSYDPARAFDLGVLATKAHDAIVAAPQCAALLGEGGTLLPIQNGGVAEVLAERLGDVRVLGGLSNLGATMVAPGVYEQRNAGHLLIGELSGARSARAERVRDWLGRGIDVVLTRNMRGATWSKLMINCSVTTIGALAGCTMREYIEVAGGRELFHRAYDEALSVALATGATPERMLVDPVPPGWIDRTIRGGETDAWLATILSAYGGVKPSMLQDFERGRPTEIDFINGHVADVGNRLGLATPVNTTIVEIVHAISSGTESPHPGLLQRVLAVCRLRTAHDTSDRDSSTPS
jgi:2-dehydropantoate 2-reductase